MTRFFSKASAKYCAPMGPILLCVISIVVSACKMIENNTKKELKILLYCFLRHQLSIVRHHLWFRFYRGLTSLTSVKETVIIRSRLKRLTVLFRNALKRCIAPYSPIWLPWRFNSVSVCVEKEFNIRKAN